jgi:hypothetical protein
MCNYEYPKETDWWDYNFLTTKESLVKQLRSTSFVDRNCNFLSSKIRIKGNLFGSSSDCLKNELYSIVIIIPQVLSDGDQNKAEGPDGGKC